MWVGFRAIWDDSEDNIREQTERIGQRRRVGRGARARACSAPIAGVTVFLCLLTVAVQVLVNLYSASVVTAAAYDAARQAASGGHSPSPTSSVTRPRPTPAPCSGESATTRRSSGTRAIPTSSGSASSPPAPRFLLPVVDGALGLDVVDRTVTVRVESCSRDRAAPRSHRDERGQVGGIEALPFGILVFVVGALLVASAWAVVDAKLAVVSAAREAARTYVEADSADRRASGGGLRRRRGGDGRTTDAAPRSTSPSTSPPTSPAAPRSSPGSATRSRPSRCPGSAASARTTVSARHSERIDPFRDGIAGEAECPP